MHRIITFKKLSPPQVIDRVAKPEGSSSPPSRSRSYSTSEVNRRALTSTESSPQSSNQVQTRAFLNNGSSSTASSPPPRF